MSVTIELPDEVLARLRAEAARRGISVEDLIAESASRSVATRSASEPWRKSASKSRLSISGVGASGGRKGWARDADESLAEGFGRD